MGQIPEALGVLIVAPANHRPLLETNRSPCWSGRIGTVVGDETGPEDDGDRVKARVRGLST